MQSKTENKIKLLLKPFIEKVDINQIYLPEKGDCFAINEFIEENRYKIEIYLGSLMSRKNMAFHLLVKKINHFFLLEFICVLLQEQGLWYKKLCREERSCNIEKAILCMRHLSNLKKK